jgi:putative tryptophan/tyrosine transport system substrate-binding protein
MGRREFTTLLGGAAVAWPLTAHSQQEGKLPTIGFMGDRASVYLPWTTVLSERLHELGWIEGKTVGIEYRWSEGRPERVADFAAEFVRLKVVVIVTYGGAVPTFEQATASIPIVFAIAVDPLGSASSPTFRTRAATSRGCRSNRTILPASGSNSCVRWSPVCADWL